MDILFLGGVFESEEVRKKSKGGIQNAANVLQWNIIRGLNKCNENPVSIMSSIFIGTYPRNYKDMIIKSYKWSHTEGAVDKNVGFINIPGIKHFSRANRIAQSIKEWAANNEEDKCIITYSVHSPFLYAIKKAKQVNPRIKVCLIVPDLPQYMKLSSKPGRLYLVLKRLDSIVISSLLKYVDSYVFLTKHMAEYFNITEDRFMVMEGMVNLDDLNTGYNYSKQNTEIKKILYTGTLNWRYGIGTLLDAFKLINMKNYRLQICGAGEAELEIINLSKKDPRIEFLGSIKREDVLELQRRATVLINPRNSEGEFTKYSFPSKNMEYLLSGRPTIAYKLSGIPKEYEKYMYFIEDSSTISMANKIIEVCEKKDDDLERFGALARDFVINQKNNVQQASRIIEFLRKS